MKLKRRKANSLPIPWTKAEERLLINHLKKGKFDSRILKELFPTRTQPSIKSKIRKIRIKYDLFGSSYREKKEAFTIKIAKNVKPKNVFDAYAGAGHQTFKWILHAEKVYACDKMKSKFRQFDKTAKLNGFTKLLKKGKWIEYRKGKKKVFFYIGDTIDAAAYLKVKQIPIDIVDLDTCGSSLPILSTILLLLRPKSFVITHGEFHSSRFKRQDVLRRILMHRDIRKSPFPLNSEKLEKELDKAVKVAGLRAHNETEDSFWPVLINQTWLGGRFQGMLRRHYKVEKPRATSDCINNLSIA